MSAETIEPKDIQNEMERVKAYKDKTSDWFNYFGRSCKEFYKNKQFICTNALSSVEQQDADQYGRTKLNFNVIEAKGNKLRGSFMGFEPSFQVSPKLFTQKRHKILVKPIEGLLEDIKIRAEKEYLSYQLYSDLIWGGFSVFKFIPEYESNYTFHQILSARRVFDPTLCGFDPMARLSHKGDGRFSFEAIPVRRSTFIKLFGEDKLKNVTFNRESLGTGNLCWSYKGNSTATKDGIITYVDWYEKREREMTLIYLGDILVNGQKYYGVELKKSDYKKLLREWEEQGFAEEPPKIKYERESKEDYIVNVKFFEGGVLEEKEEDWCHLPHIFVDGDSVEMCNAVEGNGQLSNTYQYSRPYFYQAIGAQRLKTFTGNMIATAIENHAQIPFMFAEESLPVENQDAMRQMQDPRQAMTLTYKAWTFTPDGQPLSNPPPQLPSVPTFPPQFIEVFQAMDNVIENNLGSFDSILGIQDNDVSGEAIKQGSLQALEASKPYLKGYLAAWQQCATIALDLIPKVMTLPRNINYTDEKGEKKQITINVEEKEKGINTLLDYMPHSLGVDVQMGPSFVIQQAESMQILKDLAATIPGFNQFLSQDCLDLILKNLSGIKDKEVYEERLTEFMKQQKMNQSKQPNPAQIEAQKMQIEQQKVQVAEQKNTIQQQKNVFDYDANMKKADASIQSAENDKRRIDLDEKLDSAATLIDAHRAASEHAERIDKHRLNKKDSEHARNHETIGMAIEHIKNNREHEHRERELDNAEKASNTTSSGDV